MLFPSRLMHPYQFQLQSDEIEREYCWLFRSMRCYAMHRRSSAFRQTKYNWFKPPKKVTRFLLRKNYWNIMVILTILLHFMSLFSCSVQISPLFFCVHIFGASTLDCLDVCARQQLWFTASMTWWEKEKWALENEMKRWFISDKRS